MSNKITLFIIVILSFTSVEAAKSDRAAIESSKSLIKRIVPNQDHWFKVESISADPAGDVFEIEQSGNQIILRGNNPISIASALNWYLKHYCHVHLSWVGDQIQMPGTPPNVKEKVRRVTLHKDRVYFNYCTLSYTAAWWDWKRWEREIDYMALNGFNMPLTVIGIEGVWYNAMLKVGLSDEQARSFLVGPAYLAWQWMQNIEGYGGPMPKSWIDSHVKLGKQIISRERELGMTPIQQGFSGHVPRAFKEKFPQASMKLQSGWLRDGFTGVMQLDPLDPLFTKFGRIFLEEQSKLYGTSHIYAADPFHESTPPKPGSDYLEQVGKTITSLLTSFDSKAVWAMQSWSLRKEMVNVIPKNRLLILDLNGRYKGMENFWGFNFVSGFIHNFGGRTRLHGDLASLAQNKFAHVAKNIPNNQGMGMFAESIAQNPVYYDLAFDLIWREEAVNLDEWLGAYARRRYGADSESVRKAWSILARTSYKAGTDTIFSSMIAARPMLKVKKADPNYGFAQPYNTSELFDAWEQLLLDADKHKKSPAFLYDIADIGRQIFSDLAHPLHWELADAFLDKDKKRLAETSREFLQLIDDADKLTSTQPELSFRKWTRNAQSWAKTPEEKQLYTFNSSMLLTHWGGDVKFNIIEYAWREWGGLLSEYYKPRWAKFHSYLLETIDNNGQLLEEKLPPGAYGRTDPNGNQFYRDLMKWEQDWIQSSKNYSADSQGDTIIIAQELANKYRTRIKQLFSEEGVQRTKAQKMRVEK